jgi:hypothetical protein
LLILPTCFLIGALHFASYRQGDPAQEKVPEPLGDPLGKTSAVEGWLPQRQPGSDKPFTTSALPSCEGTLYL